MAAAIAKSGAALKFASERLRADRGLALEAVWWASDAVAFQHVSEALHADLEFLLMTLMLNPDVFWYMPEGLRARPPLVSMAASSWHIKLSSGIMSHRLPPDFR